MILHSKQSAFEVACGFCRVAASKSLVGDIGFLLGVFASRSSFGKVFARVTTSLESFCLCYAINCTAASGSRALAAPVAL